MAVISLAVQLAGGIIQLYDFWGSIRDAPSEVAEMLSGLKMLSNILNELVTQKNPSQHVRDALEHCDMKVQLLQSIVREFEPNFGSNSRRVRMWSAFRAVRKKQKLQRFRDSLQETKTTLLITLMPHFQMPPVHIDVKQSERYDKDSKPHITSSSAEKPEFSKLPADIPALALHASVKSALQLAAENYFQSGAFAKAMSDTVHRVSTIQTTYRHSRASDDAEYENGQSWADSGYSSANLIQSIPRGSRSRICYRTSATGVLFGTIWLRTTSVRLGSGSGRGGKEIDVVSSFTFFPSYWLTKAGLNCGMEANVSTTPTGWQFNFNPIRAVPDDSPIFSACRKGNLSAVRFLLTEGKASVKDTNSKGWTPLHFAAVADSRTNIRVCEYLISRGADKTALAFEGPSENALSPVTVFSATNKKKSADLKIAMLRLFEDCVDLSEPDSEGWTIVGDLVSSFNQEDSSVHSNSIIWFLTSLKTDSMVGWGPKTLWHGLQHAVRSFVDIARKNKLVQRQLGLIVGGEFPGSYAMAIGHWVALLTAGKKLLPMIVTGGSIWHMEGFDYDRESEPDPVVLAKMRPYIYTEWSKALRANLERADEVFDTVLATILEELNWSPDKLRSLKFNKHEQEDHRLRCSTCNDDYSLLKLGLVEPSWIAFVDCTEFQHRYNCTCQEFLQSQGRCSMPPDIGGESSRPDSDSEDDFFYDAGSQHGDVEGSASNDQPWFSECSKYIQEIDNENIHDPFQEVALLLYRCQARLWLGVYEPGQRFCGTCFLRSEGYMDEDVTENGDFGSSRPNESFNPRKTCN
ncbi:Ankyrin repeat-containing protein [Glarea lozoyensis ATCC 20868]|uniref:Ankyrin repeat-containing protein n=1 Tax=Glarea lozoyensis (strain ATCC 20868 / MF5171) TaxID=1116229 RepID=S3CQG9_GLAL2|nr:Ankyrin repeat-containing protein [Glarea lozoyensis ATCC 20868]EPE27940.1 Ankyrin repeat-containing protein [Glarea lozoyensis ATCC 20868]